MQRKPIARLVINTQPYYGSISTVSEHQTFVEAVKAGVQYRKDNPTCNTLEIYCYDDEGASHTMECYTWAAIAANN